LISIVSPHTIFPTVTYCFFNIFFCGIVRQLKQHPAFRPCAQHFQIGIQIIASQRIGRKEVLVIALSLSFGLSVELVPEVLDKMSITVRNIFSSGITTGGLTAILSNLLIRIKET